jgi:micrococcal nuclease
MFDRSRIVMIVTVLLMVAVTIAQAEESGKRDRTQQRPSMERVSIELDRIDVGDGDTVVILWGDDDRERVRILGIDTPEVAHPNFGQPYDQFYGPEAAAFAAGVFAAANKVELLRAAETDGYGRTLGYFFVNGRNYSVMAVAAGYAAESVTHYGDNGFPEESEEVLAASRKVGPVVFEAPYLFRKRMREVKEWGSKDGEEH